MCDRCQSPDCCCCCQQSYCLQSCNGLQKSPSCIIELPPLAKLKPTIPQQRRFCDNSSIPPPRNRSSSCSTRIKTQPKCPTPKKERNCCNSSTKKANCQQKRNSTLSPSKACCITKSKNSCEKSNQQTCKLKIECGRNEKQMEYAIESGVRCTNAEADDTANRLKSKCDDSSEVMIEKLQKAMDHTMRPYFMRTTEKMECLSTQLLRNECDAAKMHLDIVEKISKLKKQCLAQFQTVIEKLNCLLKDRNRDQQKCSSRSRRSYNSEEDDNDECSLTIMNPSDSNILLRNPDQFKTEQVMKSDSDRMSKMGSDNQYGYGRKEASNRLLEAKHCCECQKRVQCLQQELECRTKELQETVRRLQLRNC